VWYKIRYRNRLIFVGIKWLPGTGRRSAHLVQVVKPLRCFTVRIRLQPNSVYTIVGDEDLWNFYFTVLPSYTAPVYISALRHSAFRKSFRHLRRLHVEFRE
jgi:hypothetical protein